MRFIIASLLALALAVNFTGCAGTAKPREVPANSNTATADTVGDNPYATSFVSRNRPAVALQPDPAGPKLYRGKVEVEDYQRMLSNGFDMLGYSSFEAGDVSPDLLADQAKKIKADLVLVYTKLTGNVSTNAQLQQMRRQALEQEAKKDSAPDGASGKLLPQEQARYAYFASYWVKLAPPLLGVHVTKTEQKDSAAGLKVIAVVNESPADKAGIKDGDVLTRIGEIELNKPEVLTQAAQRYAGQTIDITFQRDGNSSKTAVTLNNHK